MFVCDPQTDSIPKDLSKALTWADKSTVALLIIPKFWKNIQVFNDRWGDEEDVFVPAICELVPSVCGNFVITHFSVKRDEIQSSKTMLTLLNSNSYSVNKSTRNSFTWVHATGSGKKVRNLREGRLTSPSYWIILLIQWGKHMTYVCTMGKYSAIRWNLVFATICMELEGANVKWQLVGRKTNTRSFTHVKQRCTKQEDKQNKQKQSHEFRPKNWGYQEAGRKILGEGNQ